MPLSEGAFELDAISACAEIGEIARAPLTFGFDEDQAWKLAERFGYVHMLTAFESVAVAFGSRLV